MLFVSESRKIISVTQKIMEGGESRDKTRKLIPFLYILPLSGFHETYK